MINRLLLKESLLIVIFMTLLLMAPVNAQTNLQLRAQKAIEGSLSPGNDSGNFYHTTAVENNSVVFEQTEGGGNGIVSDYYVPIDAGAYSADDFALEDETDIHLFKFQGFVSDEDGLEPVLAGFRLYVYADEGGEPAGYPSGPDAAILELDLNWDVINGPDDGLSYEKVEEEGFYPVYIVTIDVEEATGDALTLGAGSYWVVIAGVIDGDPDSAPAPPRFNWSSSGDENGALPKLSDPQSLFGSDESWVDVNTLTESTDFNGLTFTVYGPPLAPCEGVPVAGTIDDAPENVCAGVEFSLSVTGQTEANGLSYQWQESSDDGDTWTDIEGANELVLNLPDGITNPTDYRFTIECDPSAESAETDSVSIGITPWEECYCIPEGSSNNGDEILNFTLSDLTNDSEPSEGVDGYSDYTDSVDPANLQVGETYIASLTSGGGSLEHGAAIWIDYNDNGIFEASEMVASIPASIEANSTVNFPPFTVEDAIGIHRLRVQYAYNVDGADMDPCEVTTFTETEDYSVEVSEMEDCEGTPDPGIVADDFSVCAFEAFSISVTGATPASNGLVRMWESSPAGEDNWSEIDGATASTYVIDEGITVPMDYRYKLSCDEGDFVYSDVISVSLSPIEDCYCIPSFTFDCILGDMIDDFVLMGEDGTSIENLGTGCSEDGYDDRTDESVYLYQGVEYTANVTSQANEGDNVAIWIDFNDDGVFDESEMVAAGDLDVSNDVTLNIPEDANIGEHRMRVMVAFGADPNNPEEFDPCNFAGADFGETHDYMVEIGELSVENHDFKNFTFYPNPVQGQLTLKAGEQIESVTVYNLLGQEVINVKPNTLQTQLNVDHLQAGVYLMNVNLNGTQKTFRVIKN